METAREEFFALQPRNKREARRWVRLHWATFMESADVPAQHEQMPDAADDLIGEVWAEESARLANRIR